MSADPTQSLLRWGIENATPGSLVPLAEDIKAGRRPDLNTDVLKAMMGTSDADRMRECVQVIEGHWVDRDGAGIKDADVTMEDKLRAWDDLEMLIEDLDNANDLKHNGLWAPIVKHLTSEEDEVAMRACWVCGTAVQNNPRANAAFLELDPLPTVNNILTSSTTSINTRNKAMYCLSSTLKHSPLAVARFEQLEGWSVLNKCLQDSSLTLRSKTAFLLSQLISQSEDAPKLVATLRSSLVLPTLLASIHPSSATPTGPNGDSAEGAVDPDYREKALRFLVNTMERAGAALHLDEKKLATEVVDSLDADESFSSEDLGLSQAEFAKFKQSLKQQ